MNKKKIIAIISVSVVIALLLAGVLVYPLLFGNKEVIAEAENTYDADYVSFCSYEHDETISIDGVLNENEWKGKKWFSNTFLTNVEGKLPVMKVTGFTTERGVYIASTVTDSNLVNNGQRSNQNSIWEFYLTASQKGETKVNDGLYYYPFIVDMAGDSYSTFSNFARAVAVKGNLNSGQSEEATLEMFIPWQTIGINPTEGIPSEFGLMPSYRAVFDGQTRTTPMDPPARFLDRVNDYYLFDSSGYTCADREGAIVGDAKFGYAKTANWDISQEAEGIVSSSIGTDFHKIFFSQEYGKNFIVETTMVPVKKIGTEPSKAGILFQGTDGLYYTVFLDMQENLMVDSVNKTKNVSKYQLVTLHNLEASWTQKSVTGYNSENTNATKQEGVKLTVVKFGGQFWYFADGKFLTCEEHVFMDVDVMPGFYAMGQDVIYKDYSCTSIDDTDALKNYLNKRGLYYVEAKTGSAGGSVQASTFTVKKGDSYDITITSKPGYVVSSITVNGVEKINDAKKKAVDGVYTVTNAKGNQEVVVKFEKCDGYIFSGNVKNADGNINGRITLYGQTNRLLRYEITSQGKNGFKAEIPAGTYRIEVEADNHVMHTEIIKLTGDMKKTFTLKLSEFPKVVKVNNKQVISSVDKWDLSKQGQRKVSTSYQAGGKMAPLYYGKTGKDFVMQATINYTTNFVEGRDYQPDLMGGFVFSDGTNTGWIVARDTGIVTTDWKFTNGIVDYNMLRYPTKNAVNFSVAKKGDVLNFYVDGELIGTRKWSEIAPKIDAKSELALGFYMIADKEAEIEFSNYSIQTGTTAATKYINEHVPKDELVDGSSIFAKTVIVNGTPLKSMMRKWDLSDIANNKVSGSYDAGTSFSPLYFMKHGKTALVRTTIEYTTKIKQGQDYQPDLFGGFTFHDGKNSGWIMANRTGIAYTGWKFEQGLYKHSVLSLPEQRAVELTVAVQDDYIYLFFDDTFAVKKKVSDIVSGAKKGADLAIGILMHTDKISDIRFSNTSVTTNSNTVKDYINQNSYESEDSIISDSKKAVVDIKSGTIASIPSVGPLEATFKGKSTKWEVTGTMTRTDATSTEPWCPGFNIKVGDKELTLNAVSQGVILNQYAENRYPYHAFGKTIYNLNTDISQFLTAAKKEMNFRAVIADDTFYVWFGYEGEELKLSWMIPLAEDLYGVAGRDHDGDKIDDAKDVWFEAFNAGSSYNFGINVMKTGCAGQFSNLVVKTGNAVDTSFLSGFQTEETKNAIVDIEAGTIASIPSSEPLLARFKGSSKAWEVTGTMIRTDATSTEAWCPGFNIKVGDKELTLNAVSQGIILNQYATNRYPYHAFGKTDYNLNTDISQFLTAAKKEMNFRAVIVDDTFYAWFGYEGEEMKLSWVIPLAEDLYGVAGRDHDGDGVDDASDVWFEAFASGSSYNLGVNVMRTGCAGQFSNLEVKMGEEVDTSFLAKFQIEEERAAVIDAKAGTIKYIPSNDYLLARFKGNSKTWEVTGTMTRTDATSTEPWCPGFNIKVGDKELTLNAVNQGIILNQYATNRYPYHAFGKTDYNLNTDISQFLTAAKKEMNFRAVIVDDTFYVWFGYAGEDMKLSWVIPLAEDLYGVAGKDHDGDGIDDASDVWFEAFSADSSYNLGVNVMKTGCAGQFSNLEVKMGEEVDTSFLAKFQIEEEKAAVIDAKAGTIKYIPSNDYLLARFKGNSKTWEITGTMTRTDATSTEPWCPGFNIKVGDKELTLNAVSQGIILNQYATNRYPYHAFGKTNYNLNTDISQFLSGTKKEMNFRAVIVDDTFYAWFGYEGEEMKLSWVIPLAKDLYGVAGRDHDGDGIDDASDVWFEAFSADSSYNLGVNVMKTGCAGQFSNLVVKMGDEADTSLGNMQNLYTLLKEAKGTATSTALNFTDTTAKNGNQLFHYHLTSEELLNGNNQVVKSVKIYLKLWGKQNTTDTDYGHQPVVILHLNENGTGKVQLLGTNVNATAEVTLTPTQVSAFQQALGTTGLDVFMAYDSVSETVDVYIGTTYIGKFTGSKYTNGYVCQMWTMLMTPEQGTGVTGVKAEVKEYAYTGNTIDVIDSLQTMTKATTFTLGKVAKETAAADAIAVANDTYKNDKQLFSFQSISNEILKSAKIGLKLLVSRIPLLNRIY